MALNILIDTIFVGNWIDSVAIAAINVVLPISLFIGAMRMSIGIGGSSIVSQSLGANDKPKVPKTFGNQITITLLVTIAMTILGLVYINDIIPSFGGKGVIFEPARIYYRIVLYGVVFLAICMMGNNVMRAEGNPKFALVAMIIPSISNLLLDSILINLLHMGMAEAAWATTRSYVLCFIYILWYFLSHNSEMKINFTHFGINWPIIKDISSLGFVTLSRQAVISVTYLLINNILYDLGDGSSVTVYATNSRMLMFALSPILGVTQDFVLRRYNSNQQKSK